MSQEDMKAVPTTPVVPETLRATPTAQIPAPAPSKRLTTMADVDASQDTEFRTIDGYDRSEKIVIGSLSAGDMLEWAEANEGEAKKTAGLRLLTKSFTTKDPDDPASPDIRFADDPRNIDKFRKRNHQQTLRIVKEILDLNDMLDDEEKKKLHAAKKD